jgi:hypothetical protein
MGWSIRLLGVQAETVDSQRILQKGITFSFSFWRI